MIHLGIIIELNSDANQNTPSLPPLSIPGFILAVLLITPATDARRARSFFANPQLNNPSAKPAAPPKRWLGLIGE